MSDDCLSGLTVLLVDDEKFSRVTVAGMLPDLGRPTVIEAANGAEALEILGNRSVDLIISDFNMPVIHGLQLLRAVRIGVNKTIRATPFAMLTGYSEKMLVDLALALDINAFLIKPVHKDGLGKRLGSMMKQVRSGLWLKDKQVYEAIDVDDVLSEIADPERAADRLSSRDMMPMSQPLFDAPRRKLGGGPVETRGLPEDNKSKGGAVEVRGLPDKSAASGGVEVLGGATPSSASRQLAGHLCPLNELPENALLARDVFTADGRLFMHAGTELTPAVISILSDLHELGHPVESIWVAS